MNNYYIEILEEIKKMIDNQKYEDALSVLKEELNMPYIPQDVEDKLHSLFKDCSYALKLQIKTNTSLDEEELEACLNGTNEQQLKAVEYLNNMNLRNYEQLVNTYFSNNPFCMARALLIDSLIDQNISYEITVSIDGQEITFIPRYVEKAIESDGFIEASKYISEEFANDNPSMEKMCMQLLVQEAYLRSPINFEEGEGEFVAISVIMEVYKMLQDEDGLKNFIQKHDNCLEKKIELCSVNIDY